MHTVLKTEAVFVALGPVLEDGDRTKYSIIASFHYSQWGIFFIQERERVKLFYCCLYQQTTKAINTLIYNLSNCQSSLL